MAQRLDLAIAPGKYLGWFRLGMSLWDIIRLLRDQAALIPVVELKYSDENPFAADIVLRLTSNGIELRFEPLSQRLKLIKVDDFSRLRLTYQGGEVSSTKALPTFLLAYKLFGPTYPGEFDGTKHHYTLSYPGLSLVFPIPEKHMLLYQSSADLPLEFPDGTTPVASHMYIFYGADWTTATPVPVSTLARSIQDSNSPGHHSGRFGDGKAELERVSAKINVGAVLQFASASQQQQQQQQKCQILLHVTTPQDLLADLGSPASIYYKEEDKMKIHSDIKDGVNRNADQQKRQAQQQRQQQQQQEDDGILGEMDDIGYDRSDQPAEGSQQPNDYFYNYFHLGIDVLFDGSTHRCKKIVMHNNLPGHFDFQSYKRCPFVLHLSSSSGGSVGQNSDPEAARLPPIAPFPSSSTTPSPPNRLSLNGSPQLQPHPSLPTIAGASPLDIKAPAKKKGVRAAAALAAAAAAVGSGSTPTLVTPMETSSSSHSISSGGGENGSARGSPDIWGSSPIDLQQQPPQHQQSVPPMQQQHLHPQSNSTVYSALSSSSERGITPDMKISTIMQILESPSSHNNSSSSLGSASGGGGTPASTPAGTPKPAVILNRGSSTQNPFGPTTLNGADGIVLEAMKNGHVVTVILY
ncbi:hypothetical protein EMPS_08080 [Entomortierella parvispora]|uniref:Uncharacterized protein n=1 Tax=Entomortierella parvispora TaxID=205924 RepID=A0A9P3HG72_9FUNG|nr:hypothetical protein EMPS_08080 [Entomortierella parvispora]